MWGLTTRTRAALYAFRHPASVAASMTLLAGVDDVAPSSHPVSDGHRRRAMMLGMETPLLLAVSGEALQAAGGWPPAGDDLLTAAEFVTWLIDYVPGFDTAPAAMLYAAYAEAAFALDRGQMRKAAFFRDLAGCPEIVKTRLGTGSRAIVYKLQPRPTADVIPLAQRLA